MDRVVAMLITRHGGDSHYVRPDGVYRTSVLQSIFGYQPGVDVQSVAQAFTQGPPMATMITDDGGTTVADGGTAPLSGLFGPGPIARLGLRIKAAWAARKANKFMFNGLGSPLGPATYEAKEVAPQIAAQMQLLNSFNPGTAPGPAAMAASSRGFYLRHY